MDSVARRVAAGQPLISKFMDKLPEAPTAIALRAMGVLSDDWWLFPPLFDNGNIAPAHPRTITHIWSDFEGVEVEGAEPHFLDYEYLYDPWDFRELTGGRWKTFRKNINRWERDTAANRIGYASAPSSMLMSSRMKWEIEELIIAWMKDRPEKETIHDDEVMLDYLLNGTNRAGLFRDGRLVGMNVWDHSWAFINFRYSICLPEPGLADYLRWRFYTDEAIKLSGKLVNDGGVLDKPSLKFYKDRLNPKKVRKVYSWKRKEGTE
jgi:hypothetical protein